MAEHVADQDVDQDTDQDRATSPDEVLQALHDELGRDGFQRALDDDHTVSYLARGRNLLVSFETLEASMRVTESGLPVGLDFVEDKHWSLLHFAARRDSWFRAPAIYEFMDDLVDDSFFEEFDRVMFYGTGVGAYAACAYSVAAPGATVLAAAPQATLDSERAGWDMRFPDAKRLRFDDRYGYAPDMLEGARAAFILFDPYRPLDHVHASLFRGPNVTRIKMRHFDGLIEYALREMELLHRTIEAVSNNTLRPDEFYHLLRDKRRNHNRYLRTLVYALGKRNRPMHVALVCNHVLNRKLGGPFFRKNLAAARGAVSRQGILPDWLARAGQPGEEVPPKDGTL